MAVRIDASGDMLSRTLSGMSTTVCTMAGWIYLDADRNTFCHLFGGVNGAGDAWFTCTTLADGTTIAGSTPDGFNTNGPSISTGAWYYIAAVFDSAGVDTFYYASAASSTLTAASGSYSHTLTDGWLFSIGNDAFDEWVNGRIAHVRVWTAALTQAQLEAEKPSATPVRTTGLWADYPLTADANDASGNARHLTVAGSVSYVAGPIATPTVLTVQDTAQAQTSENIGLVEHAVLTVQNSTQTQTTEGPITLPTGVILTIQDSAQTQTTEAVGNLVQHWALTVQDSYQAQASPSVAFITGSFPAAVSANGRYVVDYSGNAWPMLGDTAWSMIGSLTDAECIQYLDDRASRGVNCVLISCPEPYYVVDPPRNVDGALPFTGTAFQSTLNNAYWNRMDLVVSHAQTVGITLLVCPFYLGYASDAGTPSDAPGTDGWAAAIVAATNAQMATYAGYLHARYGAATNIIWLIGHDRTPGGTLVSRADAFLSQMAALNNTQLWTFGGQHARDINGADTFGIGSESWAASTRTAPIDNQYDYSDWIATNAYTTWSYGVRPFFMLEGKYEQDFHGVPIGDVLLREEMYAPFFAGAFGFLFGNNPIWNFENRALASYSGTWESNLNSAGSQDMQLAITIIKTKCVGWENTLSDTGQLFVTNQGTGTNKISARYGPNLGLIYHPSHTSGTVGVAVSRFSAGWVTVQLSRVDPASGVETNLGGPVTTATGLVSIVPPPTNADGTNDWIYIVRGVQPVIVLTIQDSFQTQTSEAPVQLVTGVQLTVQDSAQTQTSENVALIQHSVLVVQNSAQTQTSEHVVLNTVAGVNLVIQDSTQTQTSEVISLVQHYVLLVFDSYQTQTSEHVGTETGGGNVHVGAQQVVAIHYGAVAVDRVYVGSTAIWV